MSGRDDFPANVVRKLGERVGLNCSNPGCRAGTKGPHSDDHKSSNIGKAAHIYGAAPKGPRYNVQQTSDERTSFRNGIWLCSNCATMIDVDERRYPPELLLEWKSAAEEETRMRMGRPTAALERVLEGAELLAATRPRLGGSSLAMRLAAPNGEEIEAWAFPFGTSPRLSFDLTNIGGVDIAVSALFVDVVEFTRGRVEDVWSWYGLTRIVRTYSCEMRATPGRYVCEPTNLGPNEYLVLTPGELESFRVELVPPAEVGLYRLSLVTLISAAGRRAEMSLEMTIPVGVFDPATNPPVTDDRRMRPPPWAI